MTYPRVYKPGREQLFLFWSLCFILFGAVTQGFIQHPDNLKSWGMMFGFAVGVFLLYRLIIVSIGYKVTLWPDAIEVTTIHGTEKIYRSDISFYSYYCGKCESGVNLISRNSAQSGAGASLLHGKNEKILSIPLSFNRDQEFDDWVASLPLRGVPLPKRRTC